MTALGILWFALIAVLIAAISSSMDLIWAPHPFALYRKKRK